MGYKSIRQAIRAIASNAETSIRILSGEGIDITRDGFIRVRPDDRTPSCKINQDGSFHDFGSGEHYSDIVALFFDGYHAFDSLSETMQWVCQELDIPWEVDDE